MSERTVRNGNKRYKLRDREVGGVMIVELKTSKGWVTVPEGASFVELDAAYE